eukprot:PhM_4_TR1878/c0_g1_i1/m.58084
MDVSSSREPNYIRRVEVSKGWAGFVANADLTLVCFPLPRRSVTLGPWLPSPVVSDMTWKVIVRLPRDVATVAPMQISYAFIRVRMNNYNNSCEGLDDCVNNSEREYDVNASNNNSGVDSASRFSEVKNRATGSSVLEASAPLPLGGARAHNRHVAVELWVCCVDHVTNVKFRRQSEVAHVNRMVAVWESTLPVCTTTKEQLKVFMSLDDNSTTATTRYCTCECPTHRDDFDVAQWLLLSRVIFGDQLVRLSTDEQIRCLREMLRFVGMAGDRLAEVPRTALEEGEDDYGDDDDENEDSDE